MADASPESSSVPSNSETLDLAIAGGGAAGFFAAITCAEALLASGVQPENFSVRLFENSSHVLGKVKISGGGRCNVTHACTDPRTLVTHYPRGERSLIGPFHRFQAEDTVRWFEDHGVALKTEADGRMFPVTDDSQTIIDCLTTAARKAGVSWETGTGLSSARSLSPAASSSPGSEPRFEIVTTDGRRYLVRHLLIATGGTRSGAARKLVEDLGHALEPPVPSLFTFHIADDPRLHDLQGISVEGAAVRVPGAKLSATGPVLITHWGLSGPAILRLSAWGARELADRDYHFPLELSWLGPDATPEAVLDRFQKERHDHGARSVATRSPFTSLPKRLWVRLVEQSGITDTHNWSNLPKNLASSLANELCRGAYTVSGKSLNKEEFVTCGGVRLKDVNLKTCESKLQPGLYFAGEVLDIDGITGGFNFQAAWTTGHLAGTALAEGIGCGYAE